MLLLKNKRFISILFLTIICYLQINAQITPVENYLQQAGEFSNIYNGKLETLYNVLIYKNFPYYKNSEFTDASIVYNNNYYPNQKVRLDLFKEQLSLIPPEKQFGVIVNFEKVERVYMYNKTFVRLIPNKESGLKQGYYIQLLEREKIQLYRKEYFNIQQKETVYYIFEPSFRFYLCYNNKYYTVKNKGSFNKLFPKFKKEINKFCKEKKLNFRQKTDESLSSLADYCHELLFSTNNE